jgi:hypothetical protein
LVGDSLNMDHSARPTSSLYITRPRSDRDQLPPSGASELLSNAIDGLQHDSSDLTSRIVELLRNDAQATGNYAIAQQLREERRRLWIQIEELECKYLPVPREIPPAIEIELMAGPDALMPRCVLLSITTACHIVRIMCMRHSMSRFLHGFLNLRKQSRCTRSPAPQACL